MIFKGIVIGLWLSLPAFLCQCTNSSSTVIDFRNKGITQITEALFQGCNVHATKLLLSGNDITNVTETSFAKYDSTYPDKYLPVFPSLILLDLDNNKIHSIAIGAFQYLINLQTLSLSYNRLTTLESGFFDKRLKESLVKLDISHNFISSVGDSVFTADVHQLQRVDMSFNNMTYLEAWAYIMPNIRSFNLSDNNINKFTNHLNWTYDLQEDYHASVDLRRNNFTIWDDEWFRRYQKPGGDFVGDFITYNLNITENPWVCDCNMHFMASKIQASFYRYADSDLLYVYCENPSSLYKQKIMDVDPIKFVCDVKVDCPVGCKCTNISETQTLEVDCKDGSLTELPSKLPDIPDRTITLDVSNNSIRLINSRPYVSSLRILKADHNKLVYIDQETVKNMTQTELKVNISNNYLRFLPNAIQNIPYISIYNNQYECDCNMTWMAGWLDLDSIDDVDKNVICTTKDGDRHKITDVTESLLDCNYDTEIGLAVGFGVLLVVVIIGIVWAKRCPYETKVLVFKFFRYHPSDKYKVDKERKEYDLYISCDDENIHIRQWVLRKLKKKLEEKKYSVFVPIIDLLPGQDKADQIVNAMESSKRVVIILSDKYDESEWCVFECQQAEMLNPNDGRIIFIKYHPEADEMILNDPWKSRVKDRKVLEIGEKSSEHRWFWDKLIYELPVR